MWGMCGDFVTLGVLTFVRSADIMHGKITRPQHIYKHISTRSQHI
jgi:hypothetical protein